MHFPNRFRPDRAVQGDMANSDDAVSMPEWQEMDGDLNTRTNHFSLPLFSFLFFSLKMDNCIFLLSLTTTLLVKIHRNSHCGCVLSVCSNE